MATSHKGEWREQSKLPHHCALGESSMDGSKCKCAHEGGVIKDNHWSCCGSKEKESPVCQVKTSPACSELSVGSKVEARYKGWSTYYSGVISGLQSDGTYNIDYDDGDKETNVAPELIRVVTSSS